MDAKWLIIGGGAAGALFVFLLAIFRPKFEDSKIKNVLFGVLEGLILICALIAMIGGFIASQEQARFEREMRQKAEETLNYLTGADSFIYLHFTTGFDGKPRCDVQHYGEYPVHDIRLEVYSMNQFKEALKEQRKKKVYDIFELRRRSSTNAPIATVDTTSDLTLDGFPFPASNDNYQIQILGTNVRIAQVASIKQHNGSWYFAYRIFKKIDLIEGAQILSEFKELRHTDHGFPQDNSVEGDWLDTPESWAIFKSKIIEAVGPRK